GLRGRRERIVDVHEVRERGFDVPLCERGETGPTNPDLRSSLSDEREGLDPNQLALPVEVRCDHDLVRLSGEGLQGGPDLPRGHDLLWFGPDELLEIHAGPVVQGIRIIEVDDVAAEADHLDAVFALGELENGRALHVRPLRFSSAEDRRDPYRGVELLRHDESAHGKVRTQGALFNRLSLDVPFDDSSRAFPRACARRAHHALGAAEKARRIVSAACRGSGASMIAETTATPATRCRARRAAFDAFTPPIANTGRGERRTTASRMCIGNT